MERECCSNCKFAQLVWLPLGETHGGTHLSDKHIEMYICHQKRALHFGHVLLGDHACLGFKLRDAEK